MNQIYQSKQIAKVLLFYLYTVAHTLTMYSTLIHFDQNLFRLVLTKKEGFHSTKVI